MLHLKKLTLLRCNALRDEDVLGMLHTSLKAPSRFETLEVFQCANLNFVELDSAIKMSRVGFLSNT